MKVASKKSNKRKTAHRKPVRSTKPYTTIPGDISNSRTEIKNIDVSQRSSIVVIGDNNLIHEKSLAALRAQMADLDRNSEIQPRAIEVKIVTQKNSHAIFHFIKKIF